MQSFVQTLRLMYNDTDVVKHIDDIKQKCQSVASKQQKINYTIAKPSLADMNRNEFDTLIRNVIYTLERKLGFLVDQDSHDGSIVLTISWMH
jgi:hypothetical protein